MVPQGREIFPLLTVAENLATGLGVLPSGERRVPAHLLELFPILQTMLDRRGGDLSGGQQQLALARALVTRPRPLVLDEPTEGIQPSIIKDIGRVLQRLRDQEGMTTLLVEQYLDFATAIADQLLVMDRGQIVLAGAAADLEPAAVRAHLTIDHPRRATAVRRRRPAGFAPGRVRPSPVVQAWGSPLRKALRPQRTEPLQIDGITIEDTFAEAFPMLATRVVITAASSAWAQTAAQAMTGFATSVIACGVEAGIERALGPQETPDGRPGVAVLLFAMAKAELARQLLARVGQCVLTCATTACFAGMPDGERLPLGDGLRYFGDGFQASKKLGAKRYWRVPVMDGEFLIEGSTGTQTGIGGGNILVLGTHQAAALSACEQAVEAMLRVSGVILPFPGGIVRSGSKVGSKYKALIASTNDAYCPALRGQAAATALPAEVGAVLEIVIDGLDQAAIEAATVAGVRAACRGGRGSGVVSISAGNYGGKLGPHHFHLRRLLA